MHGGSRPNQAYRRSAAQLENIRHQKRTVIGGRFLEPKPKGPSDSWWAVSTDAEFVVGYQRNLDRMLSVQSRTVYLKSMDEF